MKKKNNLIKNYKSGDSIFFIDRERVEAAYINSYLAASINSKYKKKIIVYSDFIYKDKILNLYKKFGFKFFVSGIDSKLRYLIKPIFSIKSIFLTLYCIINISNKNFLWLINKFKVNNILVGDLIYDTYIRYNSNYLNPKLDLNFIKLLFVSIFRTLLLINNFAKYNVKFLIVGTSHYSFNSGIALRISTYQNRFRNYLYHTPVKKGYLEIMEHTKNTKLIGYNSLQDKKILKRFKSISIKMSGINKFYFKRKKLKTKNFYTHTSFASANKGKGLKFLNLIEKIRSEKKVVLYASHKLSDVVHMLGISYSFLDYYDQFKETLIHVFKNDDKNIWIFRPHPASGLGPERKQLHELFLKYPKKNILFCPHNVPIDKLKEKCDLVISGRGTAALEFACEQKPSIVAGTPRYFHKDLGLNCCTNKKEYFSLLNKIDKIKMPNNISKETARKILYFYENGLHPKIKIDYKEYSKDIYAKKIFDIGMKKNNINDKDLLDIEKIFQLDLENSYFYKLIRKIV